MGSLKAVRLASAALPGARAMAAEELDLGDPHVLLLELRDGGGQILEDHGGVSGVDADADLVAEKLVGVA